MIAKTEVILSRFKEFKVFYVMEINLPPNQKLLLLILTKVKSWIILTTPKKVNPLSIREMKI